MLTRHGLREGRLARLFRGLEALEQRTLFNAAAYAEPDDVTMTAGVAGNNPGILIDAIANDTDADGDPITISAITLPPGDGVATIENNKVRYVPPVGFVGQAPFIYQITDGKGQFDVATITVTVQPAATAAGVLAFSQPTYAASENNPSVTLAVTRTSGSDGSVSVNYRAVPGSASPNDFTPVSGTLTFGPGVTQQTITVPIFNDTAAENPESFTVVLESPTGGAALGLQNTATVTIADNDVPTTGGDGLKGEYFNNKDFTAAVFTRIDRTVNFNYGTGSPDPGMGGNTFSIRWTGQVVPRYSETYTFTTRSDDGVRLYVNNQLLIDQWNDHAPTDHSGTITLQAGVRYDIKLEYYENGGGAEVALRWASASQASEVVPTSQLYSSPTAGGVNQPPVANNDTAATIRDQATLINVLANDTDPDGQPLAVTGVTNTTGGTFTIEANQLRFTPTPGFTGNASATYTISDGNEGTASATVTVAVNPPPPAGNGDGLKGEYFDNRDFTAPAFTRVDPVVNFDFSDGAPAANMGPDTFSIRWTGQVRPQFTETYTFTTTTDDGVRLWVNNQLVIDQWNDHPATDHSGTIALQAGVLYDLRMEYYENGGGASAALSWSSPSRPRQVIPQSQLYSGVTANRAPDAVNDSATVAVGSSVLVNVLGNDTDADNDTLTIDGITAAPANGVAVIENGQIRYTPAAGTTATSDTLTYRVADGKGGFDTAVVTLTLTPAPQPGTLALESSQYTVTEHGSFVTVAFVRTGGSDGVVSIDYATVDQSATAGSDYTAQSGTVVFDAGVTRRTLNIPILNDAFAEGTETFSISLNRVTGGAALSQPRTATITIADNDGSPTGKQVMVIGSSSVAGADTRNSFRRALANQLNAASYNVNFVGSTNRNDAALPPDLDFDRDHHGYGGTRADHILTGTTKDYGVVPTLASVLAGNSTDGVALNPDYALVYVGHNDIFNGQSPSNARDDIANIIAALRADNPNMVILVGKLAPSAWDGGIHNANITTLNTLLDSLAASASTTASPVVTVDLNTGFNTTTMTTDGQHPSPTGEAWMADKWFNALKPHLDGTYNPPPPPAANGDGLKGEYFDNIDLTGLKLTRVDPTVNFNWGNGSPASGIASDTFSVRWTGQILPQYSQTYTFTTNTDDGVRLWVNGTQVINSWIDQSATNRSGSIALTAGQKVDIRLEYFENGGLASSRLSWASASQPTQIIPQNRLFSVGYTGTGTTPTLNLTSQTVVSNLTQPTAMSFLPDGAMLIAQKNGLVRLARNGQLQQQNFIDIRAIVNDARDRGLLGLAIHPDFATNPYVYLLFTYDPPETAGRTGFGAPDGTGARAARLLRVTAQTVNGVTSAVPGSEVVLLGTNSTWANMGAPTSGQSINNKYGGLNPDGSYVQDCIPVDSESHTIGALAFLPDGSLLVTSGDGTSYGAVDPMTKRVQDLDSLNGKVLRINPITGQGYSDNPFFNGDPSSNRSKVYALGFRNPFRLAVDPLTGVAYVGDVGWTSWEEINVLSRGANYGWPWFEGGDGTVIQTPGYKDTAAAQAFYATNPTITAPLFGRSHSAGGVAIVAGDVYRGTRYGSAFNGALFFSDYGNSAIDVITFNANGTRKDVIRATSNLGVIVEMTMGPDDYIYTVDITGKVSRLVLA